MAVVAAVVLAGCGGHELADYYPLVPGAERYMKIYTRTITGKDTSVATEIRLVETVRGEREMPGAGKVWVVETPGESSNVGYAFFRKHDDGIIQLVPQDSTRPPVEILFLALPLAKGLKWYDTRAQSEMMEVVDFDTVDVPAGRYPDCFEILVTGIKRKWTMRQWLAPDVGVVKWEQQAFWERKDGVPCELLRRAELVAYKLPPKTGALPAGK
jgi:hypothetical protein